MPSAGELWEPVRVGDDERVAILHVPAGTPTADASGPAVLRRQTVRYRPVLTLPERPDGLDDLQRLSYERLCERQVTPGLADPGHLVLGHPMAVQEDPREPGEVNVLHLGPDDDLGFDFLDAGDLTLHGSADDVRAGRWDGLTLRPNSC